MTNAEIEQLKADYEIQMRKTDAAEAEIQRLRVLLDTATGLLREGRSGRIAGSSENMNWDRQRAELLRDVGHRGDGR
jgi:hypothetical protein